MAYNRFYLSLVLHCILLAVSAYLFFFFLSVRQQPTTAAGMAILSLILVIRLVYQVNRTNRILASYLTYLQEQDPTLYHTIRHVDRNFKGLHENLEKLIHEFRDQRIDLEVQARYLEAILDNVSTGIISFNEKGEIRTINRIAGEFLGITGPDRVEDLNRTGDEFARMLLEMPAGEEVSVTRHSGGREVRLALKKTQIRLKQEEVQIVALNDITHQMEEQEISSWKKLIRVINHEIMNSMTPIITLAMAIRKKVAGGRAGQMEDAIQSASIIEERSNSLVGFIERYKKLTSLPPPDPETFMVSELFEQIHRLFTEELAGKGIRMKLPGACPYKLSADRQMMEQVLINLVKNAGEALKDTPDPLIELSCRESGGKLLITIGDNGEGIAPDRLEQVFVPFFSTREDGSGIGLSLCRQIIRLHGGSIRVDSEPGKGTEVSILL